MSVSLSLLASTALACASGACALIPQHEPSKAFNNIPENYHCVYLTPSYTSRYNGDLQFQNGNTGLSFFAQYGCTLNLASSDGINFPVVLGDETLAFTNASLTLNGVLHFPVICGGQYTSGNVEIHQYSHALQGTYSNEFVNFTDTPLYLSYVVVDGVPTATTYNPFRDGTSWVDNIGVGFGIIPNLGTAINTGLDSMFYTDGVISKTATFAFTLMGLGISVGVVSLVFKWLTGRHGM